MMIMRLRMMLMMVMVRFPEGDYAMLVVDHLRSEQLLHLKTCVGGQLWWTVPLHMVQLLALGALLRM